MRQKKVRITIFPSKEIISVKRGANLLESLLSGNIPIESLCGGKGICGKCLVKVIRGNLSYQKPSSSILTDEQIKDGYRLACLSNVDEDVTLSIPYTKEIKTNKLTTFLFVQEKSLNPSVKKVFLELKEADLKNQISDWELIEKALAKKISLCPSLNGNLGKLREIPFKLRRSNYRSTIVLYENEFVTLEEGDTTNRQYGIAFDLGTTTIAGVLYDCVKGEIVIADAILNPQHSYGVDTISRINYAIQSKKNLNTLHSKIISGINQIINSLCKKAKINSNNVYEVVVTGNTTMTHLFLNLSPLGLSRIPFVPVIKNSVTINSKELGIKINENGKVFVFPNIGGFVGGDTVAMVLTTDMMHSRDFKLAIDIGTNGETVLGNKDRLLACSNAAGPAFEGAQIKFGMRATDGAIESVKIENDDLKVKVIGNIIPQGICGSGLIDVVSTLLKLGIINKSGRILNRKEIPDNVSDKIKKRVIEKQNGNEFVLVFRNQLSRHKKGIRLDTSVNLIKTENIVLTQKDVRELQLAKGAIAAGIKILMKELKVQEDDIQEVFLSGAFGNYINVDSAVTIGLIPRGLKDRVEFIGNSASSGALMALINYENKKRAEEISQFVKYVELGGRADFQNEFANSMHFIM